MNIITQRVHDTINGRNQTVGVFVGLVDGGRIRTGWSRVSLHKGDKFNMETGVAFAMQNLIEGKEPPFMSNVERYERFVNAYDEFRNRCKRYFQQYELEKPISAMIPMIAMFDRMFGGRVDKSIIEQFVTSGIPLANALAKQGVRGVGIPVGFGGDVSELMRFINGDGQDIPHVPQANQTAEDIPEACQKCGGVEMDRDCPKRNIGADGKCNRAVDGDPADPDHGVRLR